MPLDLQSFRLLYCGVVLLLLVVIFYSFYNPYGSILGEERGRERERGKEREREEGSRKLYSVEIIKDSVVILKLNKFCNKFLLFISTTLELVELPDT